MIKPPFQKRTGSGTLKAVFWHVEAKEAVSFFPDRVKSEIGYLLYLLQLGEKLSMPKARPMPSIALGAYEIRVRGRDGVYRLFYALKTEHGVLAFHAFQKKTQKTSARELSAGKKRLKELLGELNEEG